MIDAERAANAAQFAAENTARPATEESKQKTRQAEAERQRTQAALEEVRRAAEASNQDAERLQRAAEEEKKKSDEAVAEAEAARKAAENDAREATAAKEDAEGQHREGIQPVITPTPQEIRAAQAKFNPDERYQHVWYDLPGAGTIRIPDWQYFNAQGLDVFDCIVVLFNDWFTHTDIAIFLNCRRFKIPTYIVRSKADQHIRNILKEIEYESDDENVDRSQRPALYMAAREQLVDEIRRDVKVNLAEANLPDQKVYVVVHVTILFVSSCHYARLEHRVSRIPLKSSTSFGIIANGKAKKLHVVL
ncbi:hypothetical protein EDB19DRAFT_1917640 [Suillus lakei]|nr:hypothetical protein EDB19DRAFT_1917640 [Suillus lakei]